MICQTIETRYSNGRIIAKSSGGKRLYFSYDYAINSEGNHVQAAKVLREILNWDDRWIMGATKTGYVFVKDCGEQS